MTPTQYIAFIVASITVLSVIAHLIINRLHRPNYRIIETTFADVTWYKPQVRIKGVWFNISRAGERYFISVTDHSHDFLSPHDALDYINEFKLLNNRTIESHTLTENQKITYVE